MWILGNPNLDRANIFLGGNIGVDLKHRDKFRHLALMMFDPDPLLLTAENKEIVELLKEWESLDLTNRIARLDEFIAKFEQIAENGYLFKGFHDLLFNYQETTTRNASIVAEKPSEISFEGILDDE